MGSSLGIWVLLMSFNSNFSSSNCTVKMAPGGVQVPIIKWWMPILLVVVLIALVPRLVLATDNLSGPAGD